MDVVSASSLRTASLIWQPRRGAYALTVVCKATFVLAPVTSPLAPEQEYPNEEENHWNDDPARSVYSPCDLVPCKPRAEVTLVGHAFAPHGERVRSLVARMVVGEVDKAVTVFGERSFALDGTLREGPPFSRIPLRYERAAGGPDTSNPVGVRADARDPFGGVLLPNLQPPGLSVGSPADFIAPIGFGPLAASWATRQERLGLHAGRWSDRSLATEPLPEPFDLGYFMAAPGDQHLASLRCNERIVLENLHAEYPRLVTSLPGIEPRAFVERPGMPAQEVELVPDTLWIDTDRAICTLTWRGQLPLEHPGEAGRVVVGAGEIGRPITWADLARASAPDPEAPEPIHADELLPDDEGDTPVPLPRASSPALPFTPGEAPKAPPSFAKPAGRLPRPGETIDMVLPGDLVERTIAQVAAEKARSAALPFSLQRMPAPAPLAPSPSTLPLAPVAAPPPLPPPPPIAPPPIAPAPLPPMAPAPLPPMAPPPRTFAPVEPAKPRPREPPARPAFVSPEAAKLGAAAASDAAAAATPAAPAPASTEAAASTPAAAPRPRELLELLWFDPALPPRLRSSRAFRDLLEPKATSDAWITAELPARDVQAEQADRDRRDVLRAISRAEPLDASRIDRAIDDAFDEHGVFSAPLAVAAGELSFRFDEREALKATVTAVSPLVGSDKKLRDLVTEATEALKGEWPLPDDVAEGFTRRIEQTFAQAPRAVAPGYLQGSVDKLLLEGRQYRKKSVFSEPRIRAELSCAGSAAPIPTYLPVALSMRLPLFSRFRALMIVELRTQEDQHETHPEALVVLALGRVLKERRSS